MFKGQVIHPKFRKIQIKTSKNWAWTKNTHI